MGVAPLDIRRFYIGESSTQRIVTEGQTVKTICLHCRAPFVWVRGFATATVRLYCSHSCGDKHRYKLARIGVAPKPRACQTCAQIFVRESGRFRFCSDACARKSLRALENNRRRKARHPTRCRNCGETFYTARPTVKIFCSINCQEAFNKLRRKWDNHALLMETDKLLRDLKKEIRNGTRIHAG